MAQYVPLLEWSDRALRLRKFVFDFWAETGRGPNLRQAGAGTGLSRRDIVQAYKELQTGIVVVVDQDSPNADILKAPPFSAFPSQVEMYIDDKFHSFIGCAHEAVAVSNMPHFHDQERYAYVISGTWWVSTSNVYDEKTTYPVHAGTVAIDTANTVHWDGARLGEKEPAVLVLVGMGPVKTVQVDENGKPKAPPAR